MFTSCVLPEIFKEQTKGPFLDCIGSVSECVIVPHSRALSMHCLLQVPGVHSANALILKAGSYEGNKGHTKAYSFPLLGTMLKTEANL